MSEMMQNEIAMKNDAILQILQACETRVCRMENSQMFESSSSFASSTHSPGESRATAEYNIKHYGGQLLTSELEHLSVNFFRSPSSSATVAKHLVDEIFVTEADYNGLGWASIEVDSLLSLMKLLDEHISNAARLNLITEFSVLLSDGNDVNEWFDNKKSVNGHHKVQTLKHGLQAASIILSIITTSGIDPQLLNEDVISNIINFIHHHFSNHVIPCLSNNGHWTLHSTKYSKQEKKTPKKKKTKKLGNSEELQSNSKKTKCKTPSKDIQLKQYKKIYKYILVTIGDLSILLEKVQSLISHIPLEDSNLLAICDAALQSLTLNPSISIPNATTSTNVLQTGCIGLITMIVKRYPRHRGVIVEDLFPLFLKIPTCKRTLRTFDVNVNCCKSASKSRKQKKKSVLHSGTKVITALDSYPVCVQSEYKCIQPMTAMILYLIQACVEMPHPTDNDNMESSEREKTLLQSGLIGCKKMSRFFVHNLIHRCSKRGEEGGASDFRPLLSHLVEDLLMVQMNPEFPGAEFVLFALCERICCDLLSQCSDRKKQGLAAADGTYLTTIADTLGLICSDIISKLVEHKNNPFEFPDATKLEDIRKEENRCFCGRDREYDFQLDCDRCHSWFHGTCYGIAKNDLPSLWYCDECKLQLLIIEETRKLISHEYNPNEILGEGDKSHVMRILLLNYLSKQSRGTNSVFGGTARHCHLAKVIEEYEEARTKKSKENGIDEMEFEKMITYYLSLWDNVGFTHSKAEDTKSNAQTDFLSGVGNQKLMLALNASKSTLTLALPTLLGVLVKLMGDVGMISLRKLALKAIAPVVENDPSIMTRCDIFTAVVGRLQDNAISVRERAVNLVGLYVLKMPKEAEKFHCNLLSRLNDSGISVRKRVVTIFRDLLIDNPTYVGRSSACTVMLHRIADPKEDDGVRDLILEAFRMLWFNGGAEDITSVQFQNSPGGVLANAKIVTPTDNQVKRKRIGTLVSANATAKQMIEVVQQSQSPSYLTSLVKKLLLGMEDKKSNKKADLRKRQIFMQNHCGNIVKSLVESLHKYEGRDKIESSPRVVAVLSTLSVFAEALPAILLHHVDTLLPLLKGENDVCKKVEERVVWFVCKILTKVSTCLTRSHVKQLGEGSLSRDLTKIAYNFGRETAVASVESLSSLAAWVELDESNPFQKATLDLGQIFYRYLLKKQNSTDDFSKVKSIDRNHIHRGLTVLGAICRFDATQVDTEVLYEFELFECVDPCELSWENLQMAAFALFRIYLAKNDTATKCKALKAMGGIFSSRPRVMLEMQQRGMIKELMSTNSDPELQLETLICWKEILEAEENRVDSGEAKRQIESKKCITLSEKISGDQDSDASLLGSCCIQNSSRLLSMTSSPIKNIRMHSLLLLEILLRQGLISPMDTVPVLLALQGDIQHPQIRTLALKLLCEEVTKRPDILRQRFIAGVHRSYCLQQTIYHGTFQATAIISNKKTKKNPLPECIFGHIFKESVRGSRVHCKRILKSLLNHFSYSRTEQYRQHEEHDSPRKYASLPFLSFVAEILANLPYNHLGDILFIIHNISNIVMLEGNYVTSKFEKFLGPLDNESGNRLDRGFRKKAFDLEQVSHICAEASSIILLLRLKVFLTKAYNVSEARVRDYLPDDKEKLSDRGLSPIGEFQRFDANIKVDCEKSSKKIRHKILREQYIEFQDLMTSHDNVDSKGFATDDSDNYQEPVLANRDIKRKKRRRTDSLFSEEDE